MSAAGLIIVTLIVIGAAITAVLVTVAISGLLQERRDRLEPVFQHARRAIVAALSGDDADAVEALASLSTFSERDVVKVLLDLAPSVSGTSRAVLVAMAERLGVIRRARAGLKRRRWFNRLYSARVLAAFGVESDRLEVLLADRSSEVRAQAAAWAALNPNPATIEMLIGLLGDADGLCRFAAQDALIRIGLPAVEALNAALIDADEIVAQRLLTTAAAMGDERFARSAAELTAAQLPTTRALACAVLARIGDPGAGPMIVLFLGDPETEVRLAAAAALSKLSYWTAAPDVEPLLGDASWEVRKQASEGLLAFGAPGLILLRATALGEGIAAEMAVHALQLRSLSLESMSA